MTSQGFSVFGAGLCAILGLASTVMAAEEPAASDVWRIRLGQPLAAIPDSFADFACGSDGGPPSRQLDGFAAYMNCPPEANGWREVYFRYDDELEYWAKANNIPLLIAGAGTKVYDLPVIMSVLIDASGIVKGVRMVSDPRDTSVKREDARFLQPFLMARFRPKSGDWSCVDLSPAKGETPMNGEFVKQDCSLTVDNVEYMLSARFLRGAGERQIDPYTGKFTEGQFQSHVRFEMHEL
ncbi:hypothetical protein [Devosia sp. A369]